MKYLYKFEVYNRLTNRMQARSSHWSYWAAERSIDKILCANPKSVGWDWRRVPTKWLERQFALARKAGAECAEWSASEGYKNDFSGFSPPQPGTTDDGLSGGDYDHLDNSLDFDRAHLELHYDDVGGWDAVEEINREFEHAFAARLTEMAEARGWSDV